MAETPLGSEVPFRRLVPAVVHGLPRRARWHAVAIVLLTLVAGLLPAVSAVLSKRTFDALVDKTPALQWFVLFLVAAFALAVIGAVNEHLEAVLSRAVEAHALESLLDAVSSLPTLVEMEDPEFRDAVVVAQDSGTRAPTEVLTAAMATVRTLLTVVSLGGLLWVTAPWAFGVVALGMAPAGLVLWRRAHGQAQLTWSVSRVRRRSDFFLQLLIDLQAAKEIRLFGTAGFFRRRMSEDLGAAIRQENGFDRRWMVRQLAAEAVATIANAVVCIVLLNRTATGTLSIGTFTMLLAAVAGIQLGIVQLLSSVSRLAGRLVNFRTYVALVDRVAGVTPSTGPAFQCTPERTPEDAAVVVTATGDRASLAHGPATPDPTSRGLCFHDVSFRYPGNEEWALRGIDLTIPRGATYGVVGHNGSGKTTLIKLVCRFYRPTGGTITWDGRDIWSLPMDEYRALLTGVFQDYMGYDLSLRENVTISDLGRAVNDDEVWTHLDAVGLGDRARSLGRGLDTMLSRTIYLDEGAGTNSLLSGGEWQRLAIARSLYRGARDIQLYDEPTANLDPLAEWEITRLLDQRHPRSVALCVSHRLQTISAADRIVVLHGGRIVEQGSHDDLMALAGTYRSMYERQHTSFLAAARNGDREEFPALQ